MSCLGKAIVGVVGAGKEAQVSLRGLLRVVRHLRSQAQVKVGHPFWMRPTRVAWVKADRLDY